MFSLDGNDIIRAPTLPASGGLRRRHSLPSGCCTATLLKHASLTDQDDAANNNSQDCYQDSVMSCEPRDQNSGPSRRHPGHKSIATDAGSSTCVSDPDSNSSNNNDSSSSSSSSHPLMLEEAPAGATTAKAAQAGWFRSFGMSRAARAAPPTPAAASDSTAASREATTSSDATGAAGSDGSSADEPADGVVHAFAAAGGTQGASAKVAAQIPQAATAAVDQIMARIKPGSRPRTKSE